MHNQPDFEPKKKFTLAPAEDDIGQQIINARKTVLRDASLSDGAKVLFCFLIDLAVSKSTMFGFGAVLISTTKLCENLNRCERAIWKWKRQLETKRYVWVTKEPMPNFWPVCVFHISALTSPGELSQMGTRDGLWGNGARRTLPDHPGAGARGLRRTECHPVSDPLSNPNLSNLPENAAGSGTEVQASPAPSKSESRTKCGGEPHGLRRGAVKNAAGSRTKVQVTAAQNVTGQPHKGADLIKAQEPDKPSEIEVKGDLKHLPPEEKLFKEWEDSLVGRFPSHLEKMRARFTEQRKKATTNGRKLLNRKISRLDELLDGPQPEWAEPAKAQQKPAASAPQGELPAEVLKEQGKRLAAAMRAAL